MLISLDLPVTTTAPPTTPPTPIPELSAPVAGSTSCVLSRSPDLFTEQAFKTAAPKVDKESIMSLYAKPMSPMQGAARPHTYNQYQPPNYNVNLAPGPYAMNGMGFYAQPGYNCYAPTVGHPMHVPAVYK